ncbi:MAG: peptidoglycan DD-metalloendopeptidase family protein [Bacillota bacterium]|nr:peptidoglycan DD-metalloendopeptidase family protein [Bacillota bacterium]
MDQHNTSRFSTGPGRQEELSAPEEFFCQLSDLEREAREGRRPVPKRMAMAAALLALTGLTAAGAVMVSTCTLCYAVSADGAPPLAYVRREEAYDQAVCQVEEQVSAILDTDYAYANNTRVALTIAPREQLQTPDQLTESLMETVDQVREVWVLTVDGVAAGACDSEEVINEALALAKAACTTEHTRSVSLVSNLIISADYLPADANTLSAEALAEVLLRPPEEQEEDAAVFASLDQPREDAPLLVVETVEELTYTQAIPSPVQEQETADLILGQTATLTAGTEGLESRTDLVTYRCGVEVARENLSAYTLTEPTPTIVGVGTAQGAEAAQGRFLWPTAGKITSPFGARYIFGSTSFHTGTDIANASGTPISAAAGGTVIFAGPKGSYGNLIKIDHGNGFITCYAHCSQFVAAQGDWVDQGQTIALMGSTGRSTGPHCHFEVRWQEEPIDPELCLPPLS